MEKQKNHERLISRYLHAKAEWDKRLGQADTQVKNWRLACIASLITVLLLLVGIIMLLSSQKHYVYVAEIKPQQGVVHVRNLERSYQPTQAQEGAFIARFIHNIMSLPLDPVIARKNWLQAYDMVEGKAVNQLTKFARSKNPLSEIGTVTQTVNIDSYHPVSNHSYDFSWTVSVIDNTGRPVSTQRYGGIFTVQTGPAPQTLQALLNNPLGLEVAYFSFSNKG